MISLFWCAMMTVCSVSAKKIEKRHSVSQWDHQESTLSGPSSNSARSSWHFQNEAFSSEIVYMNNTETEYHFNDIFDLPTCLLGSLPDIPWRCEETQELCHIRNSMWGYYDLALPLHWHHSSCYIGRIKANPILEIWVSGWNSASTSPHLERISPPSAKLYNNCWNSWTF